MERLAEQLRREHRVEVAVEAMDLSAAGAVVELKGLLDRRGIAVDVLVNNAGFGMYGDFVDQPLDRVLEILRLNVLTMTELTRRFAADMVKRRTGHILLIASILGYQATPGYAAYGASKAFVLLFGESLHAELEPHGVYVTVLSPGPASTSFGEVAGQRNGHVVRMLMMKPEPVARSGILAMLRRRSSVVAGSLNKVVVFTSRLTPRRMQRSVMQRVLSG
jgi:short-subunit dehydrogenase